MSRSPRRLSSQSATGSVVTDHRGESRDSPPRKGVIFRVLFPRALARGEQSWLRRALARRAPGSLCTRLVTPLVASALVACAPPSAPGQPARAPTRVDVSGDPPWHPAPPGILNFTVAGIDNAPDLHGDPASPDLALFMGGNQFMAMPDLVAAFQKVHPEVRHVFYETLPPGVLAKQLEGGGALVVGNLVLRVRADVFASGGGRMDKERSAGLVEDPVTYARNDLVILVPAGNPEAIRGLADLGRPGLRLSLPNPETEGIGRQVASALEKAGGEPLRRRVLEEKVHDGSAVLTRIHHRQTPLAVLYGQADAGVVWRTEGLFQRAIGHALESVEIPSAHNATGVYQAARVRGAPHAQAAGAFVEFLASPQAQAIFARYGFAPAGAADHPTTTP